MRTISAFANGDGVNIFGVDDDGQVVGLEQADLPRAVDRLATLISDWTRPPLDCSPQIVKLGDASVVIVNVPLETDLHTRSAPATASSSTTSGAVRLRHQRDRPMFAPPSALASR